MPAHIGTDMRSNAGCDDAGNRTTFGLQRNVACSVQVAKRVEPQVRSRFSVEDGDQ